VGTSVLLERRRRAGSRLARSFLGQILPDAVPLHDPQLPLDRHLSHLGDQDAHGGVNVDWTEPTWQAKDSNSGIFLRRKDEGVREIQVERHEAPPFGPTYFDDPVIRCPGKGLVPHGGDIVAAIREQFSATFPQVFVQLDITSSTLDRDVALSRHLGAVGDASADVFVLEPRIIREYLVDRPTTGEEVEDQGDPDPVSFDARFAEADVRVDRDSGEDFVACHDFLGV